MKKELASTFFSFMFQSFMLHGGKLPADNDQELLFLARYQAALKAFNEFIEAGLLAEAYSVLNTALEIRTLFREVLSKDPAGLDENQLQEEINSLVQELGEPQWSSAVRRFLDETLPTIKTPDSRGFRELKPGQAKEFATAVAEALGLPEDRLGNMISEIEAIQAFAAAIPDQNAELMQDLRHTESTSTMYRDPLIHVGTCKKCGYRTDRSKNVQTIISEFLSEHGAACPAPGSLSGT